jgi:RNA polymerase sigma-70 factor (ECF subfamily)
VETTPIQNILELIRSSEHEEAWSLFLCEYGDLTFQVVRRFESDADNAADCFQFVCEQLVDNSFRRLRKFKPHGPATFSTWLRAVIRNLCIDWTRKQFGRRRTRDPGPQLTDLNQAANACDPNPDPEARAILLEKRALMNMAVRRLPAEDRLLLRLRYEEDLTLDQIAKLMDLGNPQRVDRRIKHVLSLINTDIQSRALRHLRGKNSDPSVKVS